MSFWVLFQVVFNIILLAAVVALWIRAARPAKDDPRLSRGLQLLQTKISVLEDLSDRTETQVTQLTGLMEHKVKEIQQQLLLADKHLQMIDAATSKSLEVAKIFQDRIPHQEIVERQNTIKYVKAARLAHQGASVDEISQQVDLSRGEIEFIAKVNKNQLQFSEEDLPEWVRQEDEVAQAPEEANFQTLPQNQEPEAPAVAPQPLAKKEDRMTLSDLGDRFRQAIQSSGPATGSLVTPAFMPSQPPTATPTVTPSERKPMPQILEGQNSKGQTIQVRKVVFRKVDSDSDIN